MLLKQTSSTPSVNGHSDDISQSKYSMFFFLKCVSFFNGSEEESGERLKRVLVHMVSNVKLDKKEVLHGTFSCNSSIDFSSYINLDFSFFSNCLFSLNFHRCLLCYFQRFNQLKVLKNCVRISIRQKLKEIGLKFLKGDLEVILLSHKLFFLLLKIGFLKLNNHCKQLVFKTRLCHNKVNNCTLSSSFWFVMGVNKLCLQVKFESWT